MDNLVNNKAADGVDTSSMEGNKTFTQDELNHIISDRLAKERGKYETQLAEKEQELSRRELMFTAKERIAETGLPPAILDAINMADAETMEKSLEILQKAWPERKEPGFVGMTPGQSDRRIPIGNTMHGVRDAFGLK